MAVALKLLIERTEAALASEANPKKKLRLERDLASFKLTAMRAEGGDDEGDEDDDDEDGEDDKHAKAAKRAEMSKKKAVAAGHKAKGDEFRRKAAECDKAAEEAMGDEDDDEDEEAKALRAELHLRMNASLPDGAAAALASQAGLDAATRTRLEKLEKDAEVKEMRASIHEALTARRITPGEAKTLAAKSAPFVRDFLGMRPKAIVNTDEQDLAQPNPTENADIDPKAMAGIEQIVASLPNLTDEQRAKVRKDMINGRRSVAAKNGAGASTGPGRY